MSEMKTVKPRIKGIGDLIGNLSKSSVMSFFAPPTGGKTILGLELLYDISDQTGQPVLYYDTEGGGNEFIEIWDEVFKKRYPKAQVDLRTRRQIDTILEDHGHLMNVQLSGEKRVSDKAKMNTGGKISALPVSRRKLSPMAELVAKKKYGAIFYDSFTMPFQVFGSLQQNFPARSDAQALWLSEMITMIEAGAYVMMSCHETKNPAEPWAQAQMTGGKAIKHYSKVVFYMQKWTARGATAYRTIRLVRHPGKEENVHECMVKLTDDGYIDATKEDMERDKAKARAA